MSRIKFKSLFGGALIAATLSLTLLLVITHLTTPASSGPLGILVVFTLLYVLFASGAVVLVRAMSALLRRYAGMKEIPERTQYYISSVLGFVPVLYVTLLSIGGASFIGVTLIFVFTGLMIFYVYRRSA